MSNEHTSTSINYVMAQRLTEADRLTLVRAILLGYVGRAGGHAERMLDELRDLVRVVTPRTEPRPSGAADMSRPIDPPPRP